MPGDSAATTAQADSDAGLADAPPPGTAIEDRRAALLRVVRRLTDATDPEILMRCLLDEAVAVLDADWGSVAQWHEGEGVLKRVWVTSPLPGGRPVDIRPGEGLGGQAIVTRQPIISNDYGHDPRAIGPARQAGLRAGIAVPLLRDGRLLGAIMIGSTRPGRCFDQDDAESLELVAGVAGSILDGLRRARLEGALLLARTAQHHLNNQLGLTVGYADLLAADPRLPEDLRDLAMQALIGAQTASAILDQLRRITRVEASDEGAPDGKVLNLARSMEQTDSGLPADPAAPS